MHEQADVALGIGFVGDADATDEGVVLGVDKVDEVEGQLQLVGMHTDSAYKRIRLEISSNDPGAVVRPMKIAVSPHANFVLCAAGIRQVVQSDIWIVKIVHQAAFV